MAQETSPQYTVSTLTAALKTLLEANFTRLYVEAEISGWKRYPSGHAYFTLKDSAAQISAVMFAGAYERCRVKDRLKDGAKVLVYGSVSVYAPRGNYQLVVLAAKLVGEGDLMQQYLALKEKLEKEGLFSADRKRPLPFLPRRIGIVTSEAGAVIHDLCTVMTRRFPALEIRLCPALVQGADAPRSLRAGLAYFTAPPDGWRADVVILARGGGSYEDLFCFNDEALVRDVAAYPLPIVSAVGHETDYTLCDFAADVRAGTPSIAAELVVPPVQEVSQRLVSAQRHLANALRTREQWFAQRLDHLSDLLAQTLAGACQRATARVTAARQRLAPAMRAREAQTQLRLAALSARVTPAVLRALERWEARLARAREKTALLSPYGVLSRGYSLTTDATGAVVRTASAVAPGTTLFTRLASGSLESVVKAAKEGEGRE